MITCDILDSRQDIMTGLHSVSSFMHLDHHHSKDFNVTFHSTEHKTGDDDAEDGDHEEEDF